MEKQIKTYKVMLIQRDVKLKSLNEKMLQIENIENKEYRGYDDYPKTDLDQFDLESLRNKLSHTLSQNEQLKKELAGSKKVQVH